ncbi:MAG TPA: TRAP transporter substrate-binding protein [bacterium]|uniref:Lactate-binding periplasmic protein n=1 Tax=candidate division TA06 bacterium ADurb.Bin417 TaxID=1852828 RepID=A0A1V5MJZ5_UNCT6|nr:MAG: Lactate-binding periplasmic protein precursor [candidate division TA06 bacterium ADurb.Bin417]HNS48311.1 TRAP transporter substrate-binding protein [bacterium]
MRIWKIWLALVILAGCLAETLAAQEKPKPVNLTYSIFFPAPHRNTVLATEWAKEIEKRTGGRVKITIYPGGTLTPSDKCYDGVEKGISDLGMSAFAYTRGRFPLTEVIDLPLGYKSGLQATRLINAYYRKFTPKELDKVKVMYLHAHGPGLLHTKTPVRRMEDLKGMKIRCTGLAAKIVEELGGTPVAMPMGDTYDALSRGTVNGSMGPQESLQGWKWGEVVKYTTESYGAAYTTGFFVVMNLNRWNSLPPDVRKIIEKVNDEWIDKTGRGWDEIDRAGRDFTLQRKNQFIRLSETENRRWAAAVQPILKEYAESMKSKGLPGELALKFCLEQLKKSR